MGLNARTDKIFRQADRYMPLIVLISLTYMQTTVILGLAACSIFGDSSTIVSLGAYQLVRGLKEVTEPLKGTASPSTQKDLLTKEPTKAAPAHINTGFSNDFFSILFNFFSHSTVSWLCKIQGGHIVKR
jgi:hypothetical protein